MTGDRHPYALASAQAGEQYTYFGWHGWGLFCLKDWNAVMLSSERNKGSCMLADIDGPRVELSWKAQPKNRVADLQKTVDTESGKLSDRTIQYEQPDHLCDHFRFSKLVYDRDSRVAMIAVESQISRRTLVLKLSLAGLPKPLDATHTIIGSLVDHSLDMPSPWSVYDLACWVPAGFELTGRQIVAGSTRLDFARRAASITFAKATTVAASGDAMSDPAAWFARSDRKRRRWYRFDDAPAAVGRHAATLTTGGMPPHRLVGNWYRRHLLAMSWNCPETKRIYQVLATGWKMPDQLLRDGVAGVVCH